MTPDQIRNYLKGNLTIDESSRKILLKNIDELSDSDLQKVIELLGGTSLPKYGHVITNISRDGRHLNVAVQYSITLIE